MAKVRYGQKEKNPILRWIYLISFGLIALWLLSSIIIGKSPTEVLSGAFSVLPNPAAENRENIILQKDSLITELTKKLEKCTGTFGYKRAMVIVDGESLNLRSKASLVSDVIMRIPANSEVQVMYYDTKTYYLKGKAGKWCKIRYAGTEGWAWGNFIEQF